MAQKALLPYESTRKSSEGASGLQVDRLVAFLEAFSREVFSWMEGFSVYGFSAAHAPFFASLSYASAYMKRHYPAKLFCALLNKRVLKDRRQSIERLEQDRDLLLDHYAGMAPEALSSLTPEERHQVYKILRLKVIAHLSGDVELAGDLVCIPDGGKVKESDVVEERSKSGTTPSPSTSIPWPRCGR